MTSPTEQYMESLRRGQQAVFQAMESWTENAQKAFAASSPGVGTAKGEQVVDQVIDQVFDFAEQMLAMQRRFAKQVVTAAAASAASAASAAKSDV